MNPVAKRDEYVAKNLWGGYENFTPLRTRPIKKRNCVGFVNYPNWLHLDQCTSASCDEDKINNEFPWRNGADMWPKKTRGGYENFVPLQTRHIEKRNSVGFVIYPNWLHLDQCTWDKDKIIINPQGETGRICGKKNCGTGMRISPRFEPPIKKRYCVGFVNYPNRLHLDQCTSSYYKFGIRIWRKKIQIWPESSYLVSKPTLKNLIRQVVDNIQ